MGRWTGSDQEKRSSPPYVLIESISRVRFQEISRASPRRSWLPGGKLSGGPLTQ